MSNYTNQNQSEQSNSCLSGIKLNILIFVTGLLLGSMITFLTSHQPTAVVNDKTAVVNDKNTYQAGFDEAKQLALESGLFQQFDNTSINNEIFGTVTDITKNKITITTKSQNPFVDKELSERTVLISSDTKIFITSPKDHEILEAEMQMFTKSQEEYKPDDKIAPLELPELFTTTTTTPASIKVGELISITAKENISNMKEFTATEIKLLITDDVSHDNLDHTHD